MNYERIAKRVLSLRAEQHLTQEDLAEKSGVAIGTIQGLEAHAKPEQEDRRRATSYEKLRKLATRGFGKTIEELDEDATVVSAQDPRRKELNEEGLEIGLAYQRATTPVRLFIRDVLSGKVEIPRSMDSLEDFGEKFAGDLETAHEHRRHTEKKKARRKP